MSPIAITLLFAATCCDAAAPAQPNTLTAAEIQDGWLLLFDGESTFGWHVEGAGMARDGMLTLGGEQATNVTTISRFGRCELSLEARRQGAPPRMHIGNQELPLNSVVENQFTRLNFVYDARDAGAVRFEVPADSQFFLRNVKLRPVGLRSLFNGKDLSGWKETPGARGRFSVNEQGELVMTGGPGDLQTDGQWADFVLQAQVRTETRQANAGIVVRGVSGEAGNGYEVQIRNQWQGEDRAKPVDYGTGGIHDRQPARKVVSSDNEWFSVAAIADGSHLAVWVNGYPVCDFTDRRPLAKSVRQGCKKDPGPIGLHGEQASAVVKFRNIKIGELK